MGDGIEGDREVQEDEGCSIASVEEDADIVCGGEEGGLSAVVALEARLGEVQDVVRFDELGQLGVDGLLDHLGREREKRNGSEVLEVRRVGRGFLQQRVDLCMFSIFRVGGGVDGAVDGAADFRCDGGAGFVEDVVRAGFRGCSGVDALHNLEGAVSGEENPAE